MAWCDRQVWLRHFQWRLVLGRELRRRFADEQVFRDKEDIGGGVSWKQQVLGTIGSDSALLVLIEKNWASMTDAQGRLRLDQRDDPMRLEVADGLRVGATVIPLLLENAEMPGETELPEEIRAMADLNALKLRDGDWEHDIDRICALLQKDGFKCTPVNSSRSAPCYGRVPVIKLCERQAIGFPGNDQRPNRGIQTDRGRASGLDVAQAIAAFANWHRGGVDPERLLWKSPELTNSGRPVGGGLIR